MRRARAQGRAGAGLVGLQRGWQSALQSLCFDWLLIPPRTLTTSPSPLERPLRSSRKPTQTGGPAALAGSRASSPLTMLRRLVHPPLRHLQRTRVPRQPHTTTLHLRLIITLRPLLTKHRLTSPPISPRTKLRLRGRPRRSTCLTTPARFPCRLPRRNSRRRRSPRRASLAESSGTRSVCL